MVLYKANCDIPLSSQQYIHRLLVVTLLDWTMATLDNHDAAKSKQTKTMLGEVILSRSGIEAEDLTCSL